MNVEVREVRDAWANELISFVSNYEHFVDFASSSFGLGEQNEMRIGDDGTGSERIETSLRISSFPSSPDYYHFLALIAYSASLTAPKTFCLTWFLTRDVAYLDGRLVALQLNVARNFLCEAFPPKSCFATVVSCV